MDIENGIAFVTGANRGLGLVFAQGLLSISLFIDRISAVL